MGHRFCDTILDFCDPDLVKVKQVLAELEIMLPKASDSDSEDESDQDSGGDSDEVVNEKGKKGGKSATGKQAGATKSKGGKMGAQSSQAVSGNGTSK